MLSRISLAAAVGTALAIFYSGSKVRADLLDKFGTIIPDTDGLELTPNAQLNDLDLQNLEVRNQNIQGATFANSNLSGAVFWTSVEGVDFANAIIGDARINPFSKEQLYSTASYKNGDLSGIEVFASEFNTPQGWDLSGKNLESAILNANFSEADLSGANLRKATLYGFESPNPFSASFAGADFTDTVISHATLVADALSAEQFYSTADYQSKNLQKLTFRPRRGFFSLTGYDLSRWNFEGQDLTETVMSRANLAGAIFSNASLSSIDLSRTNMTNVAAQNANLAGADLFFADLNRADFTDANLVASDLRGISATNSKLQGANLRNASLRFASDLTADAFGIDSSYNQWTEFPLEIDPKDFDLTFVETAVGDFDADERIGPSDVVLLSKRLERGDDQDYLTIEPEEDGWIIIDDRFTDFVYVSNNLVEGGVSDGHPIFVDYGVNAIQTFDALTDEELEKFVASIRKNDEKNAPWLEPMFDVTQDGRVTQRDLDFLLDTILQAVPGDANLDGLFDSSDLVRVFESGEYEDNIEFNSNWTTGDWNRNGEFESGDLVVAFQAGFYEQPQRVNLVPEPQALSALIVAAGLCLPMRRRLSRKTRAKPCLEQPTPTSSIMRSGGQFSRCAY